MGISDFNFNPCTKRYVRRPSVSTSNSSGRGCVASAPPFAVLLSALACYVARRWHSSPRDDNSSTGHWVAIPLGFRFLKRAALERCRALPAKNAGSPHKPGQSPALRSDCALSAAAERALCRGDQGAQGRVDGLLATKNGERFIPQKARDGAAVLR